MIFVDASFWIALRYHRDDLHGRAKTLLARHGGEPMVTTNLVRGETWTFLRDRMGHQAAVDMLDRLERSTRIDVARVDERVEDDALEWLRQHDERVYSYVDATSFAFMRARRITDALTFDGDFAAAGFVAVRD